MQILIKSFNRPHYLERCLKSIIKHVVGYDEIVVLDDGTPDIYLNKIKENFPSIIIKKSNQYNLKSKSILNDSFDTDKLNGYTIPTDLWYDAVLKTHKYFLITEDDVWFTNNIDLSIIVESMNQENIKLTKLGWLGNKQDNKCLDIKPINQYLQSVYPKDLITGSTIYMEYFMFNKFKFYSLLYKLRLVDNKTKRKYWALNSILMGLYQKDYWLYMWKDSKNELNEKIQLKNAAVYFHKNKSNKNFIARTNTEVMQTTFKSTASGVYHQYDKINLDINRINKILNEAWLKGEFNSMENYPKDFSDGYIKHFLDKENHPDAQYDDWYQWAEKFRKQYRDLGAEVDN